MSHPNSPERPIAAAAAPILPLTMPYIPGATWLPQYKGEPLTLSDFKDKLTSMFDLYPMAEEQKVTVLVSQLSGAAQREVKSWPATDKRTVKDIFVKLKSAFETRTASEVKMQFFGCRQRAQDTVRDYALNLQEALRAVKQIDPDSVQNEDKMLKEQFVEGLLSGSSKAQLRMMALQNPDMDFAQFKDRSIRVLRECTYAYSEPTRTPATVCHQRAVSSPPVQPAPCSQNTIEDPSADLRLQVQELTKSVAALCKTVQHLQTGPVMEEVQLASSQDDLPWHQPRRMLPPRRLPRSGRRPSDQFDPTGRPICRRCSKVGHVGRECPLNGQAPGRWTNPRE